MSDCNKAIRDKMRQFIPHKKEPVFGSFCVLFYLVFAFSTFDHAPKYVMPSNSWYERMRT